jgi:hypothetical protein
MATTSPKHITRLDREIAIVRNNMKICKNRNDEIRRRIDNENERLRMARDSVIATALEKAKFSYFQYVLEHTKEWKSETSDSNLKPVRSDTVLMNTIEVDVHAVAATLGETKNVSESVDVDVPNVDHASSEDSSEEGSTSFSQSENVTNVIDNNMEIVEQSNPVVVSQVFPSQRDDSKSSRVVVVAPKSSSSSAAASSSSSAASAHFLAAESRESKEEDSLDNSMLSQPGEMNRTIALEEQPSNDNGNETEPMGSTMAAAPPRTTTTLNSDSDYSDGDDDDDDDDGGGGGADDDDVDDANKSTNGQPLTVSASPTNIEPVLTNRVVVVAPRPNSRNENLSEPHESNNEHATTTTATAGNDNGASLHGKEEEEEPAAFHQSSFSQSDDDEFGDISHPSTLPNISQEERLQEQRKSSTSSTKTAAAAAAELDKSTTSNLSNTSNNSINNSSSDLRNKANSLMGTMYLSYSDEEEDEEEDTTDKRSGTNSQSTAAPSTTTIASPKPNRGSGSSSTMGVGLSSGGGGMGGIGFMSTSQFASPLAHTSSSGGLYRGGPSPLSMGASSQPMLLGLGRNSFTKTK